MLWLAAATIALILLSVLLLWRQKLHLRRMSFMLVGNLMILRMIGNIDLRDDALLILIVEIALLVLATAMILAMRFAPHAIPWREI